MKYLINKKLLKIIRDRNEGKCLCDLAKKCPCNDFLDNDICSCQAYHHIKEEDEYNYFKKLHKILDNANYNYGEREKLCIFCNSYKFTAKEGIVHEDNCVIIELRRFITTVDKIKENESNKE